MQYVYYMIALFIDEKKKIFIQTGSKGQFP